MKLADIAVMLYNHWLDDYCSLILKKSVAYYISELYLNV